MSEFRKYTPVDTATKFLRRSALGLVIITALSPMPDVPPIPNMPPQEQKEPIPTVKVEEWAYVTRMNHKGDFLVTLTDKGKTNPNFAFGYGLTGMISAGCQITDIKPVNGGDIVKVENPDTCLPETKTPDNTNKK
jgi:hypothetical protein